MSNNGENFGELDGTITPSEQPEAPESTFEILSDVKNIVDSLVPGYLRSAVNPFEALENQQGNCFANAVIGAVALSELYDVEPSMAWSERLHGRLLEKNELSPEVRKLPKRDIRHIDLVVPRGINEFDILRLAYGLKVTERPERSAFQAEDLGGVIENYNFSDQVKADDEDVADYGIDDEPMLHILSDGEIVPTELGKSLGLAAMDWQKAATEYLAALDMSELDFSELTKMFWAKFTAMRDAERTDMLGARELYKKKFAEVLGDPRDDGTEYF